LGKLFTLIRLLTDAAHNDDELITTLGELFTLVSVMADVTHVD